MNSEIRFYFNQNWGVTICAKSDTSRNQSGTNRVADRCALAGVSDTLAAGREASGLSVGVVLFPGSGASRFGGRGTGSRSHLASLHFFDGHRAIFQERDDLCAIYLQAPVVADQALLLELVHEFTHPWAGGTNHLRQG